MPHQKRKRDGSILERLKQGYCPYCCGVLEKKPDRRKTCPHCKKLLRVFNGLLCTEEFLKKNVEKCPSCCKPLGYPPRDVLEPFTCPECHAILQWLPGTGEACAIWVRCTQCLHGWFDHTGRPFVVHGRCFICRKSVDFDNTGPVTTRPKTSAM